MERKGVSSISGSRSIVELAEFWDTHDAADFDSETYEVQLKFDIQSRHHYVAVDPELLARIRKFAQAQGLSTESLVNLWLQERVLSSSPG